MASYQDKLTQWTLFCVNLKPLLSELPFLEEEQQDLASLIEEGQVLAERQKCEEHALRETIRRRREVERMCRSLRASVATILRCKLAGDDSRLAKLGLKPREGLPARMRRPLAAAGSRPRL